MPAPTQITPQQLSRLIGTPEAPVIVDLCLDEDFALDPRLIPGAFRHAHTDLAALVPRIADRRAVIVCQKGKKISQGAAALLRCDGIAAETLTGGVQGWTAAGLPMIPFAAMPPATAHGATLWVTRHRPKVDRIACPWLIRRFIDPNAKFLFVAPTEVDAVAEKFGATAFDTANAAYNHGPQGCTFDAMLAAFHLRTDPLLHLARIIRGADTDALDLAPECAGLLAASLGLSRMYRDDLEQLDAGLLLYDMLYRWARDATGETHAHEATP